MVDYICICGHKKSKHDIPSDLVLVGREIIGWCKDCSDKVPYERGIMFHIFLLDNLKYLEQKYEEKLNVELR